MKNLCVRLWGVGGNYWSNNGVACIAWRLKCVIYPTHKNESHQNMKKCLSLTLGNNTAHLPYIVTCVYKLTVDFTFQNGHALLAHFEFSSAAQTSDAAKSLPSQTGLVVLGTCNQENQKHLKNMRTYVLKKWIQYYQIGFRWCRLR